MELVECRATITRDVYLESEGEGEEEASNHDVLYTRADMCNAKQVCHIDKVFLSEYSNDAIEMLENNNPKDKIKHQTMDKLEKNFKKDK